MTKKELLQEVEATLGWTDETLDPHTVELLLADIEQYANQRVIEEFKYLEDKSDAYREEYITSKITSCNEKKQ